MFNIILWILAACLLLPASAFSGYKNLKWNTPTAGVKKSFPHAKKMTPCYFDGVNVFGFDTLRMAEEVVPSGLVEKRVFSFLKNGLVSVELLYRMDGMTAKAFNKNVVSPINKLYGKDKLVYWDYQDKTKLGRCYLWQNKDDVALVTFGHFKTVSPDNLDWIKVKFYKKKFFDFKNQRRFSKSWAGVSKLFFR